MRILFVTSEHPSCLYGGLGTFTREFVCELRKYADVKCVYFHLRKDKAPKPDGIVDFVFSPRGTFDAFSPDARILEAASSLRAQVDSVIRSFCPDVIHCNDRQTFMPFRFDKNVFYSSHLIFSDLLSSSVLDDVYFQEVKVERCALESSAVLAVYSDFAAKKAERLTGGLCSPVVLPLGLRAERFWEKRLRRLGDDRGREDSCGRVNCGGGGVESGVGSGTDRGLEAGSGREQKKLRVCYFGRFENMQKGVNDFVFALNRLGPIFKERHNLEYNMYGRGTLTPGLDVSLIDNMKFLEDEELYEAYRDADIVVVPSRYEPFGFTALEAMASGALVLLPRGLGMDMYAEPEYNCLEIPHDEAGIADVIYEAVVNFDKYKLVRDNAVRTSARWSWKRSVLAHMYMYRQLVNGRVSQLSSAYRSEERDVIEAYRKSSDVEKLHCAEVEKREMEKVLFELANRLILGKEGSDEGTAVEEARGELSRDEILEMFPSYLERTGTRILVLTGVYQPEREYISRNVEVFSVLNEGEWGVTVRPECLPFDDDEFDYVIMSGAWETVVEPCGALSEAERVCSKELRILYNTGLPHPWQFFKMENEEDWGKLTTESWPVLLGDKKCLVPRAVYEAPDKNDYFYKTVSFMYRPRSYIDSSKNLFA